MSALIGGFFSRFFGGENSKSFSMKPPPTGIVQRSSNNQPLSSTKNIFPGTVDVGPAKKMTSPLITRDVRDIFRGQINAFA